MSEHPRALPTAVRPMFKVATLATSVALAAAGGNIAMAADWQIGDEYTLGTNTTLTLGASWAASDADPHLLTRSDAATLGRKGDGVNYNADNARLNYQSGDNISTLISGLTDFDLNNGNQGLFVRFKYWYDHALATRDGDFSRFDDSSWQPTAQAKGFETLDAYVWKDFELGDRNLHLRVGKQVLTWGESIFIQNGVNVISPLDVSAFRRPGVELKEGLMPVELVSINTNLTHSISLEAFYQYNNRTSVYDGCGTFFSFSDTLPEGCAVDFMIAGGQGTTADSIAQGRYLQRTGTRWARDSGQYGLALNFSVPALNYADVGLYYLNYHSRSLIMSGSIAAQPASSATDTNINTGTYFTEYPEDIRLFGASIATVVADNAVYGELTYRPNQPLGYNGGDMVALLAGSGTTTILPVDNIAPYRGTEVQGYKRMPVWQMTLGSVGTVTRALGSSKLTWVAEGGVNYVAGLDQATERFGRAGSFNRTPPTDGSACVATPAAGEGTGGLTAGQIAAYNGRNCSRDGLVDSWSWGYRLHASLDYENLLPATVVTPSLSWRHDVDGYGPNFQKGQQAVGLAVAAQYKNKYSAELSYNNFFGSNDFSTIDDRDFVAVNLKVSF